MIKLIELVFAWRKRRAQLKKKSPELAGLAQWFDLCENSLRDESLQLGRENQIPSGVCVGCQAVRT